MVRFLAGRTIIVVYMTPDFDEPLADFQEYS
jgi:hypothetical protein